METFGLEPLREEVRHCGDDLGFYSRFLLLVLSDGLGSLVCVLLASYHSVFLLTMNI